MCSPPPRSTFFSLASVTASFVQAPPSSTDPSGTICFLETKTKTQKPRLSKIHKIHNGTNHVC